MSLLPANEVWGKAIFSQASVCPQGECLHSGGYALGGSGGGAYLRGRGWWLGLL